MLYFIYIGPLYSLSETTSSKLSSASLQDGCSSNSLIGLKTLRTLHQWSQSACPLETCRTTAETARLHCWGSNGARCAQDRVIHLWSSFSNSGIREGGLSSSSRTTSQYSFHEVVWILVLLVSKSSKLSSDRQCSALMALLVFGSALPMRPSTPASNFSVVTNIALAEGLPDRVFGQGQATGNP